MKRLSDSGKQPGSPFSNRSHQKPSSSREPTSRGGRNYLKAFGRLVLPISQSQSPTGRFVTEGIEEALRRAKDAAGTKDILLGGGVETIRQYLRARLVDEMHLAISPILLGSGENHLSGLDLPALGYRVEEYTPSEAAMHLVFKRSAS